MSQPLRWPAFITDVKVGEAIADPAHIRRARYLSNHTSKMYATDSPIPVAANADRTSAMATLPSLPDASR
jgi:hypothetical protein